MDIYTLIKENSKDSFYIQEYLDLCSKQYESDTFENHRILPRSLYPEYIDFDIHGWNKAKLPTEKHLIAHWYLYKIYKNKETTHAFRMMVEMKRGLDKLSKQEVEIIAETYKFAKIESNKHFSSLHKDLQIITNGIIQYKIPIGQIIPDGFRLGRIPAIPSGTYITISNSDQSKTKSVPSNKLNYYLELGWIIGGLHKTIITNGIETKTLYGLDPNIPDGWVKGDCRKTEKKNMGGASNKGKPSKRKGKKYYINQDGTHQIFCLPEDVPLGYKNKQICQKISKWLPNNCITTPTCKWTDKITGILYLLPNYIDFSADFIEGHLKARGRSSRVKNRFWCHNKITKEEKMVHAIPTGFERGRLKLMNL